MSIWKSNKAQGFPMMITLESTEDVHLMLIPPILSANIDTTVLGVQPPTKCLLFQLPCSTEEPPDTDMANKTSAKVFRGV